MALHYDFSRVPDCFCKEEIIEDDGSKSLVWNRLARAMVWYPMTVGLGSIKESNIDEWAWRIGFLKRINQAKLLDNRHPTIEELFQFIGFITNVSSESRASFVKRWVNNVKSENDYHVQKQLRDFRSGVKRS